MSFICRAFCNLVVSCIPLGCIQSAPTSPPHLILHFDVNGTILLTDTASGKSTEEALIYAIASRIEGIWDKTLHDQPMSYTDFVKFKLLPKWPDSTTDRHTARKIQDDQKNQILQFPNILREMNHPNHIEAEQLQNRGIAKIQRLQQENRTIFHSFYKLLDHLEDQKMSYTIVLRTFGRDGQAAAEEISRYLNSMPIQSYAFQRGHLRNADGVETDFHHLLHKKEKAILCIQDDWDDWFVHREQSAHGKPFPIESSQSSFLSLFFDDNGYKTPHMPDWGAVASYHMKENEDLSSIEAEGRILPVRTTDALLDDDYFIRLVQQNL